jgi:hypothetical protein
MCTLRVKGTFLARSPSAPYNDPPPCDSMKMTMLCCAGNTIGGEGARKLAEALREKSALKYLSLDSEMSLLLSHYVKHLKNYPY